jgi:putative transposase
MMLIKNDLFLHYDVIMRILDIDQDVDIAWVFPVADPKGLPRPVRYSQISTLKALTNIESSPRRPSETAKRRAKKAWRRIESLVRNHDIYDYYKRNQLIREHANAISCSPTTILKDLRCYWGGGQTLSALEGHFQNCGKVADDATGRRRGRTPSYGDHETYVVRSADQKKMDEIIRKIYLKKEVITVPAAYQRLLEKHYSYLDGNQIRHIKEPGEIPSLRQFRYYLNKQYSLEERLRGRLGDKNFERDHRALDGYGLQDCLGIGHIYEIDATISDVWLVAKKDRSRIIGKPTLYLIYDKYSRLVVGFYVGLEAPSWLAARQAIISIAEDKAALCQRYGIAYDPADWPAHCAFPQQFVCDRGEMISANSSTISTNMQITVKNEPALRPDRKGTVECGFKLIHAPMADTAPGYEPPANVHKRRGKKYDKDACLTLDEFTAMLLKAIVTHNRSVMKNYPLPAELLSKGITAIPTEIWTTDLTRRTGALTRFDENFVRFSLLPEDKAKVTREGILFRGCYYTCPEAVQRGWFTKAGQRIFSVTISYDKRLVDSIYIHDDSGKAQFIEATLASRSSDYRGLSFHEVAAYEYLRNVAKHDADHHNAQEKNHFHSFADPVAEHAKREMRRVAAGKSRSSRKKDVAEDRLEERRGRRQTEAPMSGRVEPSSNPATVLTLPTAKPSTAANERPSTAPLSLKDRLRLKHQGMHHA